MVCVTSATSALLDNTTWICPVLVSYQPLAVASFPSSPSALSCTTTLPPRLRFSVAFCAAWVLDSEEVETCGVASPWRYEVSSTRPRPVPLSVFLVDGLLYNPEPKRSSLLASLVCCRRARLPVLPVLLCRPSASALFLLFRFGLLRSLSITECRLLVSLIVPFPIPFISSLMKSSLPRIGKPNSTAK